MEENPWARPQAYVTGLINQELLLKNEYLAAENRILRAPASPPADTEVSSLVNSPKNNSPEVLQPAGTVKASGVPQRRLFEV